MPRFELIRAATPDVVRMDRYSNAPVTFRGRPAKHKVWEIEIVGAVVEIWASTLGGGTMRSSLRQKSAEAARRLYASLVEQQTRRGYRETGRAEVLSSFAKSTDAGSTLLLDELFEAGDPRFVEELFACSADKKLTSYAARWLADTRPEMRRALFEYVDDGCDRLGHRGLVKHLFKGAEARADHDLLARFMVAFDRLQRHHVLMRSRWLGQGYETIPWFASDPSIVPTQREDLPAPRFSHATRLYLARRVFRWFRRLGRSDVETYRRAVFGALPTYRDEDLATPPQLLDAWSLLHLLYAWSPVLDRNAHGIRIAKGRALRELEPAPYLPSAFRGVFGELLDVLAAARSRTVRTWTIAWLEKEYARELEAIDAARLRPLLTSAREENVSFAAGLLAGAKGLETLAMAEWLALLATPILTVAPLVVAAFEKHVSPKRATLTQCVDLARASVASVAELGLRWAREKPITSADDLGQIARIATAPIESVRIEATAWLLDLEASSPHRRAEHLRDLLDSRYADVRIRAIAFIEANRNERASLPLWFALLETPYDDVRALLVRHAEAWQKDAGGDEIEQLASTVLLAVHRGSTTKAALLRKLADRAVARPADAEKILPIVAIALRSVRPAERAGALASITRAVLAEDSLRPTVARHLPELSISTQVSQ